MPPKHTKLVKQRNKCKNVTTTTIIWHSDPVRPNETVMVNGYGFESDSKVFLKLESEKPEQKEKSIKPLNLTSESLMFVVPENWPTGIYSFCIKHARGRSNQAMVNRPDIWWFQGDNGVNSAFQDGWIRFQGKCLAFDEVPVIKLISADDKASKLQVESTSMYSVGAVVPDNIEPGEYRIVFSNGYGAEAGEVVAGTISVCTRVSKPERIINVCDLGADPTGKNDSTLAIIQATERLGGIGGGVVYFPSGRYRIDSILRSGVYIKSPIKIPQNVTFRGEATKLVSLWWPDQEQPLTSLLEGSNNFCIEDLTIYTQGKHSTIITGESNVTIQRVRIRVNCYYMTHNNGRAHQRRGIDLGNDGTTLGAAISIWGENIRVVDCDIFTSNICFDLKHCRGVYIANNKVMANNFFFFSGVSEVIFENNTFTGNQLTTGGSNFALHMGASICKHTYYGNNHISHIYGGDHEALTLDGHGTAFLGHIQNITADSFDMIDGLQPKVDFKGCLHDTIGTAAFIVDGKGRGQYRWVSSHDEDNIVLDSPWLVEPDEESIIAVGVFNGRHIIVNNTTCDTGTAVQLYPPNYECIVAGNKTYRSSNINSISKIRKDKINGVIWAEMSWYNQFLDNEVVEGNAWGGGCTEIDRWIGGECFLNIWGWQVSSYMDKNKHGQNDYMSADVMTNMVLKDGKERKKSIPLSRFTVIRGHKIHNNSSIRVRGRVDQVLIEGCKFNDSKRGIRIDAEIDVPYPKEMGLLYDFDPEVKDGIKVFDFLSPTNVLMRNNNFKNVGIKYTGTALLNDSIVIEEEKNKVENNA